jgi:hypothetical protein
MSKWFDQYKSGVLYDSWFEFVRNVKHCTSVLKPDYIDKIICNKFVCE